MKQGNVKKTFTALLLLSFVIMIFTSGCGRTVASSLDLNNYVSENSFGSENNNDIPDTEYDINNAANIVDSVNLSWSEPLSNADGTPLSGDLAGYIIYYGPKSGDYTNSVDIGNFTSASVGELSSGNWCFSLTAYDVSGNESEFSQEICKTIS